jgi:hypothetical protein
MPSSAATSVAGRPPIVVSQHAFSAMYYDRTEVADQQLCESARLLRDLHGGGFG